MISMTSAGALANGRLQGRAQVLVASHYYSLNNATYIINVIINIIIIIIVDNIIINTNITNTPGLRYKIPVFSDPAPGKS